MDHETLARVIRHRVADIAEQEASLAMERAARLAEQLRWLGIGPDPV
ncbi:MAG: hypothetical protein RKP73_10650 [Candidatus Contendobacter sp.]|nr:hypothetical protein [Candidatus Contendobacter sp.]